MPDATDFLLKSGGACPAAKHLMKKFSKSAAYLELEADYALNYQDKVTKIEGKELSYTKAIKLVQTYQCRWFNGKFLDGMTAEDWDVFAKLGGKQRRTKFESMGILKQLMGATVV